MPAYSAARAIVVANTGWEQGEWAEAARSADPSRPVFEWPDVPDLSAIGYAMSWNPPRGVLASLPNLKAIFSLGAGVDHLIPRDDLPDVPVVRVVSADLTARMTEWVVLQVLMHHRQHLSYSAQQKRREWRERLGQPSAREVRVGVMGMGMIGRAAAEALARLGFRVAGWSRRMAEVPGIEMFADAAGLDAFLARTDILVCLLPLTPDTRGILAMPLFRTLARDGVLPAPVLVNAGRGGLQIEADIVAALDAGVLGGASLDVFQTEPLPADSPLWLHPKVIVTPHCAAWSSPAEIVPAILAQIVAFEAGGPLSNVVDRATGY